MSFLRSFVLQGDFVRGLMCPGSCYCITVCADGSGCTVRAFKLQHRCFWGVCEVKITVISVISVPGSVLPDCCLSQLCGFCMRACIKKCSFAHEWWKKLIVSLKSIHSLHIKLFPFIDHCKHSLFLALNAISLACFIQMCVSLHLASGVLLQQVLK